MNRKERRRMKALGLTNNSQFGVRVRHENGKVIANGEDIARLLKTDMGFLEVYKLQEKGVTHIDVKGINGSDLVPSPIKECA
jgi:hypothetical protein